MSAAVETDIDPWVFHAAAGVTPGVWVPFRPAAPTVAELFKSYIRVRVRLPDQIREVVKLIGALERAIMAATPDDWGARRDRVKTYRFFRAVVGLPTGATTPGCDENGFVRALRKCPDELTGWAAYADWLRDRGDPDSVRRADLVAGWTGPEPVEMKNGVPVLALVALG